MTPGGLENSNAEADPSDFRGRLPPLSGEVSDTGTQRFRRGKWRRHVLPRETAVANVLWTYPGLVDR